MLLQPDQIELVITKYCACWNEVDVSRRMRILDEIWASDGRYMDPTVDLRGRDELCRHIGNVIARQPGAIVRKSKVDCHHHAFRFSWYKQLTAGKRLPDGIDFGELNADGLITRIVGFFGPLTLS